MGPQFDEIPSSFGSFHIMSLIISLVVFVCFGLLAKKSSDKKDSIVIFLTSLLLLILEIIKQIIRYKNNGNIYDFGVFPFQLCSIPMYTGVIAFFIKNKGVKSALYKYMTFTGILGGFSMLLLPEFIFNEYLLHNIHSIIWHIVIASQGIYLILAKGYGNNIFKDVLPTIPILLIVVGVAIYLNNTDYGFNLMSISPVYENEPDILQTILNEVGYKTYCILYIIGLSIGVFLLDFIVYLLRSIERINRHIICNR